MDDASTPAADIPGPQTDIPQTEVVPGRLSTADSWTVEYANFYMAEKPKVIRYLIKCGASVQEADDAAQSALDDLYEKWLTVEYPKAWVRTVAYRKLLKLAARNERPLAEDYDQPSGLQTAEPVEFREEERAVIFALRQLPLAQRQVFALHYDKFKTCEIAEILGMSEDSVRQNLSRARAGLKKLLGLT